MNNEIGTYSKSEDCYSKAMSGVKGHSCTWSRYERVVAIDIYKVHHNLSPIFIRELFDENYVYCSTRSSVSIRMENEDNIHCT